MKGKFDAYVLWPLAKKFQNWIVDWSTARDFTVDKKTYKGLSGSVLDVWTSFWFQKTDVIPLITKKNSPPWIQNSNETFALI